jgi:hypothetical protein
VKEQIDLGEEEPQGYETRYCAFVDILGFSRLVEGLRDGSISFMALSPENSSGLRILRRL